MRMQGSKGRSLGLIAVLVMQQMWAGVRAQEVKGEPAIERRGFTFLFREETTDFARESLGWTHTDNYVRVGNSRSSFELLGVRLPANPKRSQFIVHTYRVDCESNAVRLSHSQFYDAVWKPMGKREQAKGENWVLPNEGSVVGYGLSETCKDRS